MLAKLGGSLRWIHSLIEKLPLEGHVKKLKHVVPTLEQLVTEVAGLK